MVFMDIRSGSPDASFGNFITSNLARFARLSLPIFDKCFHFTGEVVTSIQLAKYDRAGHATERLFM